MDSRLEFPICKAMREIIRETLSVVEGKISPMSLSHCFVGATMAEQDQLTARLREVRDKVLRNKEPESLPVVDSLPTQDDDDQTEEERDTDALWEPS